MKRKIIVLICLMLLVAVTYFACREDDPPVTIHEFPGLVFTDEYGNHLGTYGGPDDNDWGYDSVWDPEVRLMFDWVDPSDLSGTYLDTSYHSGDDPDMVPINLFPNPVAGIASFYTLLPGCVNIRLVMVDSTYNQVMTSSLQRCDTVWFGLDLSDGSRFTEGVVYRLFYSFSVEGNPDFYRGHGDILMCEDRPPNTCLRFIENR